MKLSNPKSIDMTEAFAVLRKAKLEGLEPFVETIASFISDVTTALRNKLTVSENLAAIEFDATLRHDTDTIIAANGLEGNAVAVTPLKVTPYANPIISFAWQYTIKGELQCRAKFEGAPANACTVRLRIEA